jgi:hypothetical protein
MSTVDYERILAPIRRRHQQRMDDDWVTIKGTHVLLGAGGVAMSGGKLKGLTFANAKSTSKGKATETNSFMENHKDELSKISKVPVKKLDRNLSEQEIIDRLAGPDKTGGSCASVAYAYIANKAGLDVLDFRGGKSREFFGIRDNGNELAKLPGVKSALDTRVNDYSSAHQLYKSMEQGKEYMLRVGRHAAIVRKTGKTVEWLELQDSEHRGWHELNDHVLKLRFGAKRERKFYDQKLERTNSIVEVESLGKSAGFAELMSNINTSEANQQKGVGGGIK